MLGSGTNIFLGPMGSGKSSVVDALCFALYGTYPKLGRRDVKLDEVANFRHTGQGVWVEVEWDEGSEGIRRIFKARRELNPPQAWLYADGKLLQKGSKAVSEEVGRLLGIPYELFARAVYAEQNRLDYWLSLPAGSRKSELDRLLGLDSFETARTKATARLNLIKEQAAALEAAAPAARLEEARAQHLRRQNEWNESKKQLGQAQERLETVGAQAVAAQAQYAEGEKTQKHLQGLAEKRQKLLGTIATLDKMLGVQPGGMELGEAQKRLEEMKAAREEAQKASADAGAAERKAASESGSWEQKARAEGERAARAGRLGETLKQMLEGRTPEQMRAELAIEQVRLTERLGEAARLEGRLADARKVMDALEVHGHLAGPQEHETGAACPVCKQPLDEERLTRLRKEEQERCAHLKEEQAECGKAIALLRGRHEKLVRHEAEVARLEAQLSALAPSVEAAGLDAARQAAATGAAGARQAAAMAAERLAQAAAGEHEAAERVRKLEQGRKWQEQLVNARSQLSEVDGELASITFSTPLWNDLLVRREKLMREQAGLEEQQRSLRNLIESRWQLQEAARLVVEELENQRGAAAQKRAELDELGSFRTVLVGTQAQLRALLISEINGALSRLWPLVYPYGDWTAVRLVGGEKDYSIEIRQGEWKALEAHASGGERACLGLCLRAALSILLTPQLGWLILDEPTHNLDGRAVASLGRAMAEKLPQIIGQVIVITHEGQLLESTPGRVLRFRRDKEKGEDTAVETE